MNRNKQGQDPEQRDRPDPIVQAEARAERAQAENLAKSEFLAGLSHELRTPLNGLLGMVDLMQNADDPEDRARYAEFARKCAAMIDELVEDVLEFSQAEAGRLTFRRVPFSPRALAADVEQLITPLAAAKGLWLHVEVAEVLPERLVGDPGRLRQVLINLLTNAVKFTEQGDVRLKLDGRRAGPGRFTLEVQVDDTGQGIAPTDLQRIFLPYTRLEGDRDPKAGSGLGLALCRQLIERQGGQLGVDSELGLGSRFWFSLILEMERS